MTTNYQRLMAALERAAADDELDICDPDDERSDSPTGKALASVQEMLDDFDFDDDDAEIDAALAETAATNVKAIKVTTADGETVDPEATAAARDVATAERNWAAGERESRSAEQRATQTVREKMRGWNVEPQDYF